MRRKDREITDIHQIVDIMRKCDTCCLALFDKEYPYIIPLNFGVTYENDTITLYFHGASVGKKLDLIKQNNKASFEMDCGHKLITGENDCDYTMEYESVCGRGHIIICDDDEKVSSLINLMKQYGRMEGHNFTENDLKAVTVFKLVVDKITGKKH